MRTNKAAFKRMQRVSAILAKRFAGQSLADIAAAESPPCTVQNISSLIQRALGQMPQHSVAEIRLLEAGRLDAMQNAIWPQAKLGDPQAINTVLAIMARRARLLGLDLRPATVYVGAEGAEADAVDPHTVRVEIIGDPEPARVRWLESELARLMAERGETPKSTSLN